MAFGGIDPQNHKFWVFVGATQLFVNFSKAYDSIHRVMGQILLTYILPKEPVAAILGWWDAACEYRIIDSI